MLARATTCAVRVALGLCVAPSTAFACLCELVNEPSVRWQERAVIFEGTVLTVDPPSIGALPEQALFVVDAVWHGPVQDTVTLVVEASAPCLTFTAGRRYLVTADLVAGFPVARKCSPSFSSRHAEDLGHVAELGTPSSRRGVFGANAFDGDVIPVGAPAPAGGARIRVALVTDDPRSLRRVSVADFVWAGGWAPPSISLPGGTYRLRVEWADGAVTESYLGVRCEDRFPGGRCLAYRYIDRR
jgi:hypothetical protein